MRKLVLIAVVSLLGFCFADGFTGFLGIPFGTSQSETRAAMESKGWYYSSEYSSYSESSFIGKKYAGKSVLVVETSFYSKKLYSVKIVFEYYNYQDFV